MGCFLSNVSLFHIKADAIYRVNLFKVKNYQHFYLIRKKLKLDLATSR
jgi:hypothetical protein